MGYLLGIDLGSTSTKAVAYDLAGKIVASHSVPAEIKHLDPDHPDWAFWDPEIVWNSTIAIIKNVLDQIGKCQRHIAFLVHEGRKPGVRDIILPPGAENSEGAVGDDTFVGESLSLTPIREKFV